MAKIYLFFGQPLFEKGLASNELWAFNKEVSIETANIDSFRTVMKVLIGENKDGDTYFDLCLYPLFHEKLVLPSITTGHYEYKRTKYPKITIHGHYIKGLETKRDYFITDEIVSQLGKEIEDDFDYEFIESKRSGKIVLKNNEVIYHLGNKPHIYHNEKFIEVKEK
jgi:hypothetical protein